MKAERRLHIRNQANTVIELTKGFSSPPKDNAMKSLLEFTDYILELTAVINLGDYVYHKDLYWGHEKMKVVGIRESEIELQGDWSGGTHNVNQTGWMPLNGICYNKQP